MITNACGIYKITNIITGDYYIGSSLGIRQRTADHRKRLRSNRHKNQHLQRAWNKYGEQAFTFEAVLLCDLESRLHYEQVLLDGLKPHYNIATCAKVPALGMHRSEEEKRKLSEANKGALNPMFGRRMSDEQKRKLSETHKLLWTEEYKLNHKSCLENLHKGRRGVNGNHYNSGKHPSEETRRKISESLTGRRVSEETKQKLSETSKRYWAERKGNI